MTEFFCTSDSRPKIRLNDDEPRAKLTKIA